MVVSLGIKTPPKPNLGETSACMLIPSPSPHPAMSLKPSAPPPPPPRNSSPLTPCPTVSRVPAPAGCISERVAVPHALRDLQAPLPRGASGAGSSTEGQQDAAGTVCLPHQQCRTKRFSDTAPCAASIPAAAVTLGRAPACRAPGPISLRCLKQLSEVCGFPCMEASVGG